MIFLAVKLEKYSNDLGEFHQDGTLPERNHGLFLGNHPYINSQTFQVSEILSFGFV